MEAKNNGISRPQDGACGRLPHIASLRMPVNYVQLSMRGRNARIRFLAKKLHHLKPSVHEAKRRPTLLGRRGACRLKRATVFGCFFFIN